MLAVLMSMKPEWWEKILDGEKTLEIRKTHPQNERLEWPVTVLVYVSGTGAVQGQFLCPGEVSYRTMQDLEEMSCVPREDLLKYAKGRRLSGWIVQSPEKFDAPSPLAEFGLDRPPMSWQYVEIPDAAEEEKMFVIMDEISPWPPVNCNDCRNVSCTEAEQEKAMGKPPHICREYKKRVFHGTNKRGFHSCLHPCVDCIKDRFRKFESRGKT